jgi:hypothetical protein
MFSWEKTKKMAAKVYNAPGTLQGAKKIFGVATVAATLHYGYTVFFPQDMALENKKHLEEVALENKKHFDRVALENEKHYNRLLALDNEKHSDGIAVAEKSGESGSRQLKN